MFTESVLAAEGWARSKPTARNGLPMPPSGRPLRIDLSTGADELGSSAGGVFVCSRDTDIGYVVVLVTDDIKWAIIYQSDLSCSSYVLFNISPFISLPFPWDSKLLEIQVRTHGPYCPTRMRQHTARAPETSVERINHTTPMPDTLGIPLAQEYVELLEVVRTT